MRRPDTMPRPDTLAAAGEWLSANAANNRLLGWMVIGRHIRHLAYEVSATPAAAIPGSSWATFPGSFWRVPGPFPRFFFEAGVVSTNQRALSELQAAHPDAQPAVGFRFGRHVMTAVLGGGHPPEFGMGLGQGGNAVTAGFYVPDTRELLVPEHAVEANPDLSPCPTRQLATHIPVY